ncbi:MAG TPA: amino acid adenylation domain-containing protein, partial [Longimicrobiaceae bacterium]|nr:amino acid adenylation domain-containing protein [Longimicrobiaceae bacterium]
MSPLAEATAGMTPEQRRTLLAEMLRRRGGESRVFPLSFAQHRLWFLDRMEPGSASYNLARAARLLGDLHTGVLERALGEIVRRHASLRTTFTTVAGEPAQVVAPAGELHLPVVDVPGATPEERDREALRLADEEARAPFDLARGPLLRATLLRLAEREHVLVLVLHHIVTDGWSMGVLFRELAALYTAFSRGEPSPLPDLTVQYPDFAAWQRKHLSGERLDAQTAYWRKRLAGAPPALDLPVDRPRPPVQTQRGGEERLLIPAPLVERLRDLIRSEGATLFMALLAALQALLAKYAGQEEVVVGIPVASRTRAELEGLIGFFVNTLAIRTSLAGDPSFRELLGRVREGVLEAQAHQDLPFERLVEELRVERSLSRSPVFQVMFALHSAPASDVALPGLVLRRVELGASRTAKFDLSVESFEREDGVEVRFEYSADLFEPATVARMAGHFAALLRRAAAAPDVRLSGLSLLAGAERERVLREWNDTARTFDSRCAHELFAEQAERTPGAPAVTADDAILTYAELDRRSSRLARFLRGRGVGPESRVGICLERGAEMVVAVLGVLRAGGAYLPIDPAYPAERQRFVLADAGIALLLTREELAATLPVSGVETVLLDADAERIAREPDTAPEVRVSGDNLAYVIYTSGSTGTPKGVLVRHAGFANLLLTSRDAFGLGPGDVVPVTASYAFDIWGFEALTPLMVGGSIRIVSRDEVRDVARLVERIADATVLHAVPALMRQVVAAVSASPGGTLPAMRRAFVGGDAVPPELLPEMREAFPNAEVRVLYGPTEATILASSHLLAPGETVDRNPLGCPLPNVQAYVLDGAGEPVPAGVPGELHIGGAGVARGYLGRPELTAERFVPDPFSGEQGARLYRTGDRARWRADGTLEFLGRTDEQVKIRGFRIEPGEVEAVLRDHPAVRDAVVVAREDAPGDRRLVGYVIPAGEVPPVAELRALLRERLPEHMVPAALSVLDAFPLTPAGKIDRRALPAPDGARSGAEYVAPRTPVEEILAGIWAEVLGAERVGVHDNFFELGGHSLLATRVQSRVRTALGVEMPLRALFEAPTVAGLAALLESVRRGEQETALPPLVRVPRDGDLPLSFAQERLWVIDRLDPGSPVYNMPVALRLSGRLDAAALRAALDALFERHESLRTVFPAVEGRPAQRILPPGPVPFALEELPDLPAVERAAAALDRVRAEARRSFDVETGPLFRAVLLRLADEEHVLALNMHHIVSDGWSTGVLFGELGALYAALVEGRPSPLAELPVQYADFAVWQRGWLRGEILERQLAYWREELAGAPPELDLPTDRARPAVWSSEGALHAFALPPELRAGLQALARREGATLFMALLAAFQALLARYAGEEEVVVGTPVAGRTREALEGVVGFFVNTLALRGDLSGDPSFLRCLARVREATLGAYQHQDLPFERLVEELHPERSLNRNPVFQVMFTLQSTGAPVPELPGVTASPLETGSYAAKFDLALGVADEGDRLLAGLGYAAALFDAATVERMAGHLRTLLERIVARPEACLSELSLLGMEEERRLLVEWNDTATPLPPDLRAHDLVSGWAERDPDAVAVRFGGETLRYGELEARSNRLARYLAGLGVRPETPVAICMEASPEMVVGVLAVLKAGGAYVPLDPAYPAERLRTVLEDAAAPVLLTRSRLADRLPARGARVVSLDTEWERISRESDTRMDGGALPENLAYVIYTSGSTGKPKGVRVEHRNLGNLLLTGRHAFGMGPGDLAPGLSSFAFDIWALEVLMPLASGGATRIVPRDRVAEVEWLAREIGDVTTLHAVPALMRQLAAAVRDAGPDMLPRLRRVFVGGDAVPPDLLAEMTAAFPAATVHVLYGPTEGTVVCAAYPVPADDATEGQMIGAPLPGFRLYVVDRSGAPVPTGVPGELCIGGVGVARGYLGRPELTAEKFVPDPFSGDRGARLYRSGDRARWRAGGSVEFLGRIDQQVKIRGFRIEPGEVEAVLRDHPAVGDAVVIARQDVPGELRLVGYVAAAGDARPAAGDLRAYLKERLPEHMVPAALVVLDAFPLTPTGKVDRRALPAPEGASPLDAQRFVAPRTPTEELLAEIWAEVLGRDLVGARDSFFELGGHSLMATRLASRVRGALGVALPVRAVFEAPTVAELAERVDALRRAGAGIQLPPLARRGPAEGDFLLSFAQERLWMLHQMDPESSAYNMPFCLRLEGELDVGALRSTLDTLAARHPALRTTFPEVGERPVQRVVPPAPAPLVVEDLAGLPEEERRERARARAVEEARRPFDLAGGPLFRAALLRLAEDEHHLLLSLHHIVGDGWSIGVVFRELGAVYAALYDGRPVPLAEPAVRYTDYSTWQREWLSGEVLERQAAWWRGHLAGAPPVLDLPTDRPRPPVRSSRGAEHRFALSP